MYGQLALDAGERLINKVMRSAAGFYIGTCDEDGLPFSRESTEYFPSQDQAEKALETGAWTQRLTP